MITIKYSSMDAYKMKTWLYFILCLGYYEGATSQTILLPTSSHYKLHELAEGVYAAIHNDSAGYAICNAGIIDLGDRVLVIDPFISPLAAADLKRHAEELTGKEVRLVINLHYHNDHTRGNQVFKPQAMIMGTASARSHILDGFDERIQSEKVWSENQLEQFEASLKDNPPTQIDQRLMWYGYHKARLESYPNIKATPPDLIISDTIIIYGTKRRIVIIPTATAHTEGDMVVYLPDDNILFLSDQLFNERHPYMGDGNPKQWKSNLIEFQNLNPKIVVPGHGPLGGIEKLKDQIDYIDDLNEIVSDAVNAGMSLNEVKSIAIPEKYGHYWLDVFFPMNLEFLYHESRR